MATCHVETPSVLSHFMPFSSKNSSHFGVYGFELLQAIMYNYKLELHLKCTSFTAILELHLNIIIYYIIYLTFIKSSNGP